MEIVYDQSGLCSDMFAARLSRKCARYVTQASLRPPPDVLTLFQVMRTDKPVYWRELFKQFRTSTKIEKHMPVTAYRDGTRQLHNTVDKTKEMRRVAKKKKKAKIQSWYTDKRTFTGSYKLNLFFCVNGYEDVCNKKDVPNDNTVSVFIFSFENNE